MKSSIDYNSECDRTTPESTISSYSIVSNTNNGHRLSLDQDDPPRQCVVCHERTSCYHYDVPSCTGCKTFFRRCLISDRRYVCNNGGHCEITKGVECRSCRFDRCLTSGMNAEAIQYPKSVNANAIISKVKQMKLKLIEDNRPVVSQMLPAFFQDDEQRDINFLLYLEAKQRRLRESDYNPTWLFALEIKDILDKASELSLADKYSKPPQWPISSYERAIEYKKYGGCCSVLSTTKKKFFPVVDFILSIEFAKVMPHFQKLSIYDKEALAKHVAVVNSLFTQSFYSSAQGSEVIIHPNGFIPLLFDRLVGRADNVLKIETHSRSVQSLNRTKLKPEEFVLLKAIIFSHPAIPNISQEAAEELYQYHERYSKVLMHFVQNEYGLVAGASRYASIIQLIEAFFHFGEKVKLLYLMQSFNPNKWSQFPIIERILRC
uniref:Nuclear receptor domain-containing protein n=1 Tax=Panagrellus redivivus TaxID=6233 RepID=A0A7E4ZSI7_PANRE